MMEVDFVVNVLDLSAFVLVTPDLVGVERLGRLQEFLRRQRPMRLLEHRGSQPTILRAVAALVLAMLILGSGSYIGTSWAWATRLHFPDNYIAQGLVGLWGGFLIFALVPGLYMLGVVPVILGAELLERVIRRWKINGIMLFVGAVVFTLSRSIAIWHSLQ